MTCIVIFFFLFCKYNSLSYLPQNSKISNVSCIWVEGHAFLVFLKATCFHAAKADTILDRKQYIKELRWTPQVSEGFLYIDLILHRHVHLIMHTLISISAHIHMKHKKWYVTCVGAKDIYIYMYTCQSFGICLSSEFKSS